MIQILILLVFLSGCGITEPATKRQSKLSRLDIGQTPAEVRAILGEPNRVRASGKRSDGNVVKLFEYEIYGNYRALGNALACPFILFVSCFWDGDSGVPYWMQFVDGKLERWGRAGDWQTNKFQQDITIRNAPN